MLDTLRYHGYVRQNPETKQYYLGFRFLEISSRMLEHLDVRAVAREHLRDLNQRTGQTVHLAMLNEDKVVYIDKLGAQSGLSLVTYVGFATDAYAAAGGKVLLADLDESRVRRMYHGKTLKAYGRRTITSVDDLIEELETVRQQGYAIDDEEYYEGVRCISAPIRAGFKAVAALSITGSIFALTHDRIKTELKDLVVDTAAQISANLSG
jgi:DNA-binding IclR family transcriptional regulator